MTTSTIRSQSVTPYISARATSAAANQESGPSDSVSLGNSVPGVQMRPSASPAPTIDLKARVAAEQKETGSVLPTWMRGVGLVLTGAIGLTALTGCTGKTTPTVPTGPVTQEVKDARAHLSTALSTIEKDMKELPSGGNGQQQAETMTRRVMDAVRKYSQESGRKGAAVAEDVRTFMADHPAVTITALFALGTTAGVGLEKAGLSEGVSNGVHAVWEWAKEHPYLATGIAVAAAGGTAYLISQLVSTEGEVPPKPDTPEGRQLEENFKKLEERINANPNLDGAEVHRSLFQTIEQYKESTGKAWEEVTQDVKAFIYEHPVLAATIITTAGVGTGVVLERAGVPDKVAGLIGTALNGGKNGAQKLGQLVKEHPVISGAVAVGVATGVGYLVYQHYHQAPAAPAAQAPAN